MASRVGAVRRARGSPGSGMVGRPRRSHCWRMTTSLQIRNTVRDFEAWKAAFDKFERFRADHGVRSYRVLRGPTTPRTSRSSSTSTPPRRRSSSAASSSRSGARRSHASSSSPTTSPCSWRTSAASPGRKICASGRPDRTKYATSGPTSGILIRGNIRPRGVNHEERVPDSRHHHLRRGRHPGHGDGVRRRRARHLGRRGRRARQGGVRERGPELHRGRRIHRSTASTG